MEETYGKSQCVSFYPNSKPLYAVSSFQTFHFSAWVGLKTHALCYGLSVVSTPSQYSQLIGFLISFVKICCLLFIYLFIYLFGVLCHFQHCIGHITTGSWKGRGKQYIQFARVLYCKLPTNGKQLPAFLLSLK